MLDYGGRALRTMWSSDVEATGLLEKVPFLSTGSGSRGENSHIITVMTCGRPFISGRQTETSGNHFYHCVGPLVSLFMAQFNNRSGTLMILYATLQIKPKPRKIDTNPPF